MPVCQRDRGCSHCFIAYYVFDIEYLKDLANTCNFLDACVGQVDRKLKILLSALCCFNFICIVNFYFLANRLL